MWPWCAVVAVAALAADAPGELVDQVAAEVNGERIMLSTVRRDVRDEVAALPESLSPDERRRAEELLVKRRLLEMVRERVILQQADKEFNDHHKALLEKRVAERMAEAERQAGGREALVAKLRAEGFTLDGLRADLRRRITVASYLASKEQPALHVTRQQLLDYYRRRRKDFQQAERRTWRIIVIRSDRFAARAEARARADEVRRRLAAGGDFPQLVAEFSHGLREDQGGLWGPMARDEFAITEVADAIFALTLGAVSEVIETPAAFYLVKLEGVEPAVDLSFEEAQGRIRETLLAEQRARHRQELAEQLQQKAVIHIYYR